MNSHVKRMIYLDEWWLMRMQLRYKEDIICKGIPQNKLVAISGQTAIIVFPISRIVTKIPHIHHMIMTYNITLLYITLVVYYGLFFFCPQYMGWTSGLDPTQGPATGPRLQCVQTLRNGGVRWIPGSFQGGCLVASRPEKHRWLVMFRPTKLLLWFVWHMSDSNLKNTLQNIVFSMIFTMFPRFFHVFHGSS